MNLDREYFGLKIKYWAALLGVALIVGLYLRHRNAAAAAASPIGGQRAAQPRRRGGGGGRGYRTVRTTVTKPGRVVVVNRYRCPPGTHRVGKNCVKNKPRGGGGGGGGKPRHRCKPGYKWSPKRRRCIPTGTI